jgi:toxin ParE1/3/4
LRVVVAQDARDSLKAISAYLRQYSPAAARHTRVRITARIKRLAEAPRAGRMVPEFEVDALREFIEGNYRIWYRIEEDRILVIAVFHAARDV